ncbi:MAG TPA: amino acid permease [Chthoniobacteraceae bacterium]|nr:amino acid permease [Chthoniobacteraceae bacterium]
MSSSNQPQQTTGTLGLGGLTINAMALIAPGAFLWLTFEEQSLYGAPLAGQAMWFGILAALALCFATAYSYSELSKIYPGPGSSYLYAEQAFMSKTKAYKFARLAKFITGWASHLYYWVYPGLMVGVTAMFIGYMSYQFWPGIFSPTYASPLLMIIFCVFFALFVGWIASRGVNGSTAVNTAINVIQISALLVFSVIAIGYRMHHHEGDPGWHLSNGVAIQFQVDQVNQTDSNNQPIPDTWANNDPKYQLDDKGNVVKDKDGKPVPAMKQQDRQVTKDDLDASKKDANPAMIKGLTALGLGEGDPYPVWQKDDKGNLVLKDGAAVSVPFTVSYNLEGGAISGFGTKSPTAGSTSEAQDPVTFNYHPTATSVIAPHSVGYMFIQACIAILILVGFESITSMAHEAKDPKKDVGRAVMLSLIIQGAICYMFEYFAANYLLHNGYTIGNAGASTAPIGDMMVLTGSWLFGSYAAGKAFMLIQAFTVFLALIGTTLACMNTGARVTYAMGKDEEVGAHFGLLHGKTGAPTKAIWTLAVISIFVGIVTVLVYLGGTSPAPLDDKYKNIWYSFGIFSPDKYPNWPNTFLIVTLVSNFGTFLLYMLTCAVTIVAFKEHDSFHGFKHIFIPVFGLLANLACMLFYLLGPTSWFGVAGMSFKEPYIALAVAGVWGIYGAFHFLLGSKKKDKTVFVEAPSKA